MKLTLYLRRWWYIILVALAAAEELEMSRETLTEEECKIVVKKVQESNRYTEEAILPICKETAASPKCEFFSEALSLASSHPDFTSVAFCKDITEAHFCSKTMDMLLSSPAIADLMLGECMRRSKEKEGEKPKAGSQGMERCLRLQKILSYAIHNDDLDTMRTCYMIQAYGDLEGPKEEEEGKSTTDKNESSVPPPKERIITSSGHKTDDLGEGDARNRSAFPSKAPPGQAGIVLQPVPLDSIGKGKAVEKKVAAPATKEENKTVPAAKEAIIVEPIPRQEFTVAKVDETKEEKKVNETSIIVDSHPRDELEVAKVNQTEEKESAPPPPIVEEPIPLKKNETALVSGRKHMATSKIPVVALLAKARPVAHHI
jgi:hypothetical protein